MPDVIVEHEYVSRIPLKRFIEVKWHANNPIPPDAQTLGIVRAHVNHGRWIVDCPTPGCNSAMLVSFQDQRYACPDCGEGWWDVVFPPFKLAIERLLLLRPLIDRLPSSRNWEVTETVGDLVRENQAQGLGV